MHDVFPPPPRLADLKADGCGDPTYYAEGYKRMGAALEASGREIVFSCSWPAYLGTDEATKPFASMIADGCNLWRNYIDVSWCGGCRCAR